MCSSKEGSFMHSDLSSLFDEGIEFVTTMLKSTQITQVDFRKNESYDAYRLWLNKVDESIQKEYSDHPVVQLLRSSIQKIDSGNSNLLVEHQNVLDLILRLIRNDYRIH